jgi:hypothetical protein
VFKVFCAPHVVYCMQPAVRTLTEADIASGKYTSFDVVYPLPGAVTEFPAHQCGRELIDTMLAEDGLAAPDVWTQRKVMHIKLGVMKPLVFRYCADSVRERTDAGAGCVNPPGRSGCDSRVAAPVL